MCLPNPNLASKQNRLESSFLKLIEPRIQDKQLSLNKQEALNQDHLDRSQLPDLNLDKCNNSKTDPDQSNRMQGLGLNLKLQDLAHSNLKEEGHPVTSQQCLNVDHHSKPQSQPLNSNMVSSSSMLSNSSSKFSHLPQLLHQCFQESKMEV